METWLMTASSCIFGIRMVSFSSRHTCDFVMSVYKAAPVMQTAMFKQSAVMSVCKARNVSFVELAFT